MIAVAGDLLDDTRTKFTLGSPEARQALESYEDVIFKQNISINPQLNAQQRWWTRYFNGTVAIWDSPSWNNTYLSNVEFQWDIAPTLASPYTGKRGAFLDTRGHGILTSSKHPK
jgi:ABC-type glycerol-3-phosphate transport system substrate-binding protein